MIEEHKIESMLAERADQTFGAPLAAGVRLQEFEITRLIGQGGFGIVYLARDQALQRQVAIKEYMPAQLARRDGASTVRPLSRNHEEMFELGRRSFLNEARLLARFRHPGLLEVLRFWEQNGTAYMVMPYYEGITLTEHLKKVAGGVDQRWLITTMSPIIDALEHMHAANCFHRDVAPDNILMRHNGRALLLDFGAARRVIGDRAQALTVMLKPGYAPIEQYADDPGLAQGPYTDIYALSAVMYFAILGKVPPAAASRLMHDTMAPLSELRRPGFGRSFLAALDCGLSVRPEHRPQTIAAFRELLLDDERAPDGAMRALGRGDAVADRDDEAGADDNHGDHGEADADAGDLPTRPLEDRADRVAVGGSALAPKAALAAFARTGRARDTSIVAAARIVGAASIVTLLAAAGWQLFVPTPTSLSTPSTLTSLTSPTSPSSPTSPTSPTSPSTPSTPAGEAALVGASASVSATADATGTDSKPAAAPRYDAPGIDVPRADATGTDSTRADATLTVATLADAKLADAKLADAKLADTELRFEPRAATGAAEPRAATAAAPAAQPRAAQKVESAATGTPPVAPRATEAASARPAAPVATTGTVRLAVKPWGEVWVDGVRRGVSPPLKSIALEPGTYTIELRNPGSSSSTRKIVIRRGTHVDIDHHFQ